MGLFGEKKSIDRDYRKSPPGKSPRVSIALSQDLKEDLEILAKKNKRLLTEEINARLIAAFHFEEEFMFHDRLMRIIFNNKFAYRGKKDQGD